MAKFSFYPQSTRRFRSPLQPQDLLQRLRTLTEAPKEFRILPSKRPYAGIILKDGFELEPLPGWFEKKRDIIILGTITQAQNGSDVSLEIRSGLGTKILAWVFVFFITAIIGFSIHNVWKHGYFNVDLIVPLFMLCVFYGLLHAFHSIFSYDAEVDLKRFMETEPLREIK